MSWSVNFFIFCFSYDDYDGDANDDDDDDDDGDYCRLVDRSLSLYKSWARLI